MAAREHSTVAVHDAEGTAATPATRTVVIRPAGGMILPDLRELWQYSELLLFLTWRDLAVRYQQTALGVIWAILQPTFTMVVFSVFLGRLAKVPSDGVPYPVFSYCALLPWIYFANSTTLASNALVNNANILTKIYFPRLVLPLASILIGLVDFALAFVVLVFLMLYYHIIPSLAMLWIPAFLLLAVATALGVGTWLAAINVRYRDIRLTIPFLIQLWLFATPVAYSSSLVHGTWHMLYDLNPMAGVVEGFRWALLGTAPPGSALISSLIVVAVLVVSGTIYFQSKEHTFADTV
jgi:lipopolysaccharide transport system permease protein